MSSMKHMASGCQNAKHGLRLIQNLQAVVFATLRARASTSSLSQTHYSLESQIPQPTTGYQVWESWISEAERWASAGVTQGSPYSQQQQQQQQREEEEQSPGQCRQSSMQQNRLETNASPSSLESFPIPHVQGPEGLQGPSLYNWPDDWNSLGLSGFESLEFPVL